jgi:hypothetical protein
MQITIDLDQDLAEGLAALGAMLPNVSGDNLARITLRAGLGALGCREDGCVRVRLYPELARRLRAHHDGGDLSSTASAAMLAGLDAFDGVGL